MPDRILFAGDDEHLGRHELSQFLLVPDFDHPGEEPFPEGTGVDGPAVGVGDIVLDVFLVIGKPIELGFRRGRPLDVGTKGQLGDEIGRLVLVFLVDEQFANQVAELHQAGLPAIGAADDGLFDVARVTLQITLDHE